MTIALTIRPQFAVEYHRRLSQQGVGHFGPKFKEEESTDVSQILTRSGETRGYCMQKNSCRYLLPFEHNARTCQTDKQTHHGTVTSIAI